jgi:hypothetical protein
MFSTRQKRWQPSRAFNQGSITGIVILVISILATVLLLLNRQYVIDQLSVWQYKPSQDVTALAERARMNGHGIFLFYANHPSINDATSFNNHCGRKEMSSAILGCYNGQQIYIYNVMDARLDGIREVTAAHEMLHAAYVRLNEPEKSQLHELLNAEYEKLKKDKDLAERMSFYERTEPGERDNELHSIIGTEVLSIGSTLEGYYKKYFDDRSKVVALHQKYAKVFKDLQNRGEEIATELSALAITIENESALYNADVNRLNHDITAFNAKAGSGELHSDEAFQAARSTLVLHAEALEGRRMAINANLARYDQLRSELTAIARESEALNKSIDSSLAPAPSL